MKLTVFFDGQFWVGVVEQEDDEGLKVARHLFGAEPSDSEVYAFVRRAIPSLLDEVAAVSPANAAASSPPKLNPKRRKREAAAAVRAQGVSTFAQEALKRDLEARKQASQRKTRQQAEEARDYKRQIKVEKARERHRGR